MVISLVLAFPIPHQMQEFEVPRVYADEVVQSATSTPVVELNPLLARIALCESGNSAKAKNKNSTASGRFQFIKSSWKYYGKQLWGDDLKNKDVFDWDDNTELAVYVFNKNGTSDWLESKACWGK